MCNVWSSWVGCCVCSDHPGIKSGFSLLSFNPQTCRGSVSTCASNLTARISQLTANSGFFKLNFCLTFPYENETVSYSVTSNSL